ncbi:unnamed protein product [Citrullus colocynthis]|uniref:Uncharacterized protein n=1 Tax=Citrullus colocynthis TaxID=252529 RepID=A0ABP0Y9Y9_9ROSI
MASSASEITILQMEMESPGNVTGGYHDNSGVSSPAVGVISGVETMLRKFHAGYFRIGMSVGCQTLLWKIMAGKNQDLLHPTILICEFLHHVGVNYLFAPWISWFLLLQSAPFLPPRATLYKVLWWVFAIPVVVLDVKIYGQWFTKGRRFLSSVANPTSQLSVIGNLVGAQAAGRMGWKESALCLFSLGIVHYLVLFVTLYQRFSGVDRLPSMLRPVFFLYIAAPSFASLAWESISGAFDTPSKMLFFLSLFLFTALICRPLLFKRAMKRFSIAWWAFSFPISALALASIEYYHQVKAFPAKILMLVLLIISVFVVISLVAATVLNSSLLLPDDDPLFNPTTQRNSTLDESHRQESLT